MPNKVQPIPKGYHTVTPYLIIDGAAQAIDFYKKAYALDPKSPVIGERLAEMYWKAQRTRDAVTEAQEILKRHPDDAPGGRQCQSNLRRAGYRGAHALPQPMFVPRRQRLPLPRGAERV